MSKHIGIVACSAEGAALCYRTICQEAQEFMGKHAHPEISLHNHCLEKYMVQIDSPNQEIGWAGVADLMLDSAEKLRKMGCDFLICPDNTIHQCLHLVLERSPLPWLSIAQAVGSQAKAANYRKLGILGTRYLMNGPVYPQELGKLDIAWETPSQAEKEEVNRIIFDELVNGSILANSRSYLQDLISSLANRGCDGVILGCTELPLIIEKQDASLPILDSTRILARHALRRATS
jgi:aspartate racemase